MPRAPASIHTGELGVATVRSICSRAGQLFRELTPDVGVDGLIEVCDGDVPTGRLIGVQVKSGNSFLSTNERSAILPTDADHIAYWARCAFPMIGVIHIPARTKAYWINISRRCTEEAVLHGPYALRVPLTRSNELTPDALRLKAIPEMLSLPREPLSVPESRALLRRRAYLNETPTRNALRAHEWQHLIDVLSGISSSDEDVADAGYRLSWYFPAVSERQKKMLKRALREPSDLQLTKLIRAVHLLIVTDRDWAADAVADLVSYIPRSKDRILRLLDDRLLPPDAVEGAIQVVEYIEQEFREDLRARYQRGHHRAPASSSPE